MSVTGSQPISGSTVRDSLESSHRPKRPRIACFGYAERSSGSVSGAGFLILKGLLERGYEIDFFGYPGFAFPDEISYFPNLCLIDLRRPRKLGLIDKLNKLENRVLRTLIGVLLRPSHRREVMHAMRQRHRTRHYDLELFLGTWAFGRMKNVPVISWVQGAPGSDCRSVHRHADQIIQFCGRREFVKLKLYSSYRQTVGLPPFKNSDFVIVGSKMSAEILVTHNIERSRIFSLPYPLDLDQFAPADSALPDSESNSPPLILWLGRIVPRKRLDLFLGACEQLLDEGIRIRVEVFGGFPFAAGYKRLLHEFRYPAALQYSAGMPRSEVPGKLQCTAVVVQPSEEEDFGSTVAEALACGVSVVIGPTNGTRDYVGQSAEVFERYEIESVAAALKRALSRVALSKAACAADARSAAQTHFALPHILDSLEGIFASVCFGQK